MNFFGFCISILTLQLQIVCFWCIFLCFKLFNPLWRGRRIILVPLVALMLFSFKSFITSSSYIWVLLSGYRFCCSVLVVSLKFSLEDTDLSVPCDYVHILLSIFCSSLLLSRYVFGSCLVVVAPSSFCLMFFIIIRIHLIVVYVTIRIAFACPRFRVSFFSFCLSSFSVSLLLSFFTISVVISIWARWVEVSIG